MSTHIVQNVEVNSDSRVLAEKLNEVVGALKRKADQPAVAEFNAATELVEGFQTKASIRQFTVDVDEPPALFGTDTGPNPVELVLGALGTCQEIVYAAYAAVLGIPIDSLRINVNGRLDLRGFLNVAEIPAGFADVDYEVNIKSPAPSERIRQLAELVNAHCPVLDTIQRPVPVSFSVVHNDAKI